MTNMIELLIQTLIAFLLSLSGGEPAPVAIEYVPEQASAPVVTSPAGPSAVGPVVAAPTSSTTMAPTPVDTTRTSPQSPTFPDRPSTTTVPESTTTTIDQGAALESLREMMAETNERINS